MLFIDRIITCKYINISVCSAVNIAIPLKKIGSARQKKYIKITSFSKSGIDKFSTMNETEIL